MPQIIPFLPAAKAKAELNKHLSKGKTEAKGAKVPEKKAQAFAHTAEKAAQANALWERPNLLAMCRKLAGGDIAAGYLLNHILYVWRNRHHKLQRKLPSWPCDEWLAHSRDGWAAASGLTSAEMAKRALPRLRKYCGDFLMIRAMGHGPAKMLWVSVDMTAMQEHISGSAAMPWDMFYAALNGVGPGNEKQPANAYAKA